ncbi:hypothetical protein DFH09DRAFT_1200411 [Mycena vulgaris]|nr:hypothetical protein DFH09DRAFT_1200411 [Mycena vulgaris]
MDAEAHSDTDSTSGPTVWLGDEPESSRYAGAFFPGSQQFTVAGGLFTSNVTNINHASPALPPDFRVVPLGDIYLRNEIRLDDETGVVERRGGGALVRRMYSARIEGRTSDMTVALYQGDYAEENWRDSVAKHSYIRHPSFVQIYGLSSACGMYATILHDDLIPLAHFVNLYRDSQLLTAFMYAYCDSDFFEAKRYFESTFHTFLAHNCRFWIRRSTGRLSTEVAFGDSTLSLSPLHWTTETLGSDRLGSITEPTEVISILTLDQYHAVCYEHLCGYSRYLIEFSSEKTTVRFGSILLCPAGTQTEGSVESEIAFLSQLHLHDHWRGWTVRESTCPGEFMSNGWTRHTSRCVSNSDIFHTISLGHRGWWLSQANYIFNLLNVTSTRADYVLLYFLAFTVQVPEITNNPPDGYLFLCPVEKFQTVPSTFSWPECTAYWSLDPSGVGRLTPEAAEKLGFPALRFYRQTQGRSWDAQVYTELDKFHQAKGFNPASQEVARHLEHPLYQLSVVPNAPFAHVNFELSGPEEDGAQTNEKTTSPENISHEGASQVSAVDSSEKGEAQTPQIPTTKENIVYELTAQKSDHEFREEEPPPFSHRWKAVMLVKLALISFLALYWLYEYLW